MDQSESLLPAPVLIPGVLDPSTCAWLARAAMAAYAAHQVVAAQWPGNPTRFIDDPISHTQAWIGLLPEQDAAILAFRGTEDVPQDWLTDADMRRRDNPWLPAGGRIHRGFLRGYEAVAEAVETALDDLGQPSALWLCGHSLGGALATLAAVDYTTRNRPVAGVLTIGQPRVGDRAFASAYAALGLSERHRRVAHIRDPVTRVPPSLLGWAHVGERWLFNRFGHLIAKPAWYDYLLDTLNNWFGRSNEKRAHTAIHAYLAAHGGQGYADNLSRLADQEQPPTVLPKRD